MSENIRIQTAFLLKIIEQLRINPLVSRWRFTTAGGNVLAVTRTITDTIDVLDFQYNPED